MPLCKYTPKYTPMSKMYPQLLRTQKSEKYLAEKLNDYKELNPV